MNVNIVKLLIKMFSTLTQKINLPFQRPTADSLALSVVCLLTVRVLDISDKKNKDKIQRKNKLDRTKTIKKRFNKKKCRNDDQKL